VRHQQAGDIGAGHQQQEPNGPQQEQQSVPHVSRHRVRERHDRSIVEIHLLSVLISDAPGNRAQVRTRLRNRHPIANAAETSPIMRGAAGNFRLQLARNPYLDPRRKIKPVRHHAGYRINRSLHPQVKSREVPCPAEISLPIAIADDGRRSTVKALFFGHKGAAAKRFDTERFEKAIGNRCDIHPHRLAAAGN